MERVSMSRIRFPIVLIFGAMVLSDDYRSEEYRKYIEENFTQTKQHQKIERILTSSPINSMKINLKAAAPGSV